MTTDQLVAVLAPKLAPLTETDVRQFLVDAAVSLNVPGDTWPSSAALTVLASVAELAGGV